MNINKGIETLARKSARRPWVTVGAWGIGMAVSIGLTFTLLGGALVNEIEITNNPESLQADNLIKERLASDGSPQAEKTIDELLIVKSTTFKVDDPEFRKGVEELFADVVGLGEGVVRGGAHYYLTGDESMVSSDRDSALVPLMMPQGSEEQVEHIYAVGDAFAEDAQFEVYYTGTASFNADSMELAEDTLAKGETVGIMVALVVLAVVFGAIVAATLPIALGIGAIVAALGLTSVVGQVMDLSFFITNMVTMMGLAVGIDYSLFIVSRYREERHRGLDKIAAIGVTSATANRAIFFSGITVILALVGLLVFPLSIFKSMGTGAILVVTTAVLASMTLLPALVSLLGDHVNSLRIPFIRPNGKAEPGAAHSGFWAGVVRIVTRRSAVSLVLTSAILIVALTPFFDRDTGFSGVSGMPDDMRAKQGFLVLQEEFHIGMSDPAKAVIDGDIESDSTRSAIARLQQIIASDDAFAATSIEAHPDKNLAIIYAGLSGDSMSKDSMEAVGKLRSEYIPEAFALSQDRVLVTGGTAGILDFIQTTDDYTPFIFIFVLSLSFVILMLAFRSVVIPATAILMNLLSVGAAYGLLVLVFQKGVGAEFFGFTQVEVIESWLPLLLFSLLFGLSMDYQVFLLSRIRERYLQTGNTSEAVAFGLSSTGKLITGAALIMVAVFGGFALGDMTMFQQMGFGLGAAVLVDATLVRSVLVPATMTLLGKYNWYLPGWLGWLPNVSIGETDQVSPAHGPAGPMMSSQPAAGMVGGPLGKPADNG